VVGSPEMLNQRRSLSGTNLKFNFTENSATCPPATYRTPIARQVRPSRLRRLRPALPPQVRRLYPPDLPRRRHRTAQRGRG
jgi:hypothetical protein